MRTFSSEIQRPSAAKLWQSPAVTQLPIPPRGAARETPDDVQAASYLAASDRISSFSIRSTCMPPFIEHMFFFSLSWSTSLAESVQAPLLSGPKRYNGFTARKFGNIIVNQDCMPGKASPQWRLSGWWLFEKSEFASFSTNSGECCVKKPRNPKGFLRFLPCIRLLFAKNPAIPVFFKQAPKTIKRG